MGNLGLQSLDNFLEEEAPNLKKEHLKLKAIAKTSKYDEQFEKIISDLIENTYRYALTKRP